MQIQKPKTNIKSILKPQQILQNKTKEPDSHRNDKTP